MLQTRLLLSTAFLVLVACSPEDGDQSNLLSGGTGGGAASSSTVPGASGTGGPTSTTPMAGRGTGAAGQGTVGLAGTGGVAGQSGAGAPATVAGAGGASTAGAAAAGSGSMTAGAGGAAAGSAGGASGAGAAGSGGSTAGSVMVQFTTVSYGGEYAPLNYGAVWFERGSSGFVKTAKRWAGAAHATDLVAWTMASMGWGSVFGGGGNAADMMDAVSSATLRTHQTHMVTWNMMDAQKQLVADGEYVAVLEMSESRARDQAGQVVRIKFTKGPMPQTVMVPDEKSFTGISLRYTP
jgi:hypothetical protein